MRKISNWGAKSPKTNRILVIAESAITAGLLCIPIMTPFYLSIGLNQEQIALSQMIFTAVLMILNVPMGWVADRFSRKWANVIGDSLAGTVLLFYAQASSLTDVVICEILLGLALALSQGVDSSLLKYFSDQEDDRGKLFRRSFGLMTSVSQLASLGLLLLGGPIGAISPQLAICSSSVSYYMGAIFTLLINDDSPKLKSRYKNPLRDMGELAKRCMKNPVLRIRIIAYAWAREVTHGIIWVFTPLMLMVGVPVAVVSIGWVLNEIFAYVGTILARKLAARLKDESIFIMPFILIAIACIGMAANLNIATVWLYCLFGVAKGWAAVTMMPLVKERVKANEQVTVESIARALAQLVYIGAIYIINCAADIELVYSVIATAVIFVPASIPIALTLRKQGLAKS